MPPTLISTDNFRKHLSGWISKNEQEYAEWLFRHKEQIPQMFRNHKQKLYRGMSVSADVIDILNAGLFVTKKHTSWSKSENIAKKFITDPKYQIADKKDDKLIKIILYKTITPNMQVIDIDSFVLFMGMQQLEFLGYDHIDLDSATTEQEVLIAKELKISKTEYKILK